MNTSFPYIALKLNQYLLVFSIVPVFKGRPRKRKINNVVNVVNNNNTHNNNNNDSNGIKPLVNEKKIKLEDPIPIIVETKDEKPLITEPVAKPSTSVLPNSNIQATSSVTVSPSVKQSSSIQVSTSLQSSSSADTSPIFNSNFLRKGKSGTVVDEAFLKHESIVSPDSADKSKIMKVRKALQYICTQNFTHIWHAYLGAGPKLFTYEKSKNSCTTYT